MHNYQTTIDELHWMEGSLNNDCGLTSQFEGMLARQTGGGRLAIKQDEAGSKEIVTLGNVFEYHRKHSSFL